MDGTTHAQFWRVAFILAGEVSNWENSWRASLKVNCLTYSGYKASLLYFLILNISRPLSVFWLDCSMFSQYPVKRVFGGPCLWFGCSGEIVWLDPEIATGI